MREIKKFIQVDFSFKEKLIILFFGLIPEDIILALIEESYTQRIFVPKKNGVSSIESGELVDTATPYSNGKNLVKVENPSEISHTELPFFEGVKDPIKSNLSN